MTTRGQILLVIIIVCEGIYSHFRDIIAIGCIPNFGKDSYCAIW